MTGSRVGKVYGTVPYGMLNLYSTVLSYVFYITMYMYMLQRRFDDSHSRSTALTCRAHKRLVNTVSV